MKMMKILFIGLLVMLSSTAIVQAADDGVYELRTYLTNDGKLDDLNARFRDHTIGLFDKHGMTSIGYWTPVETPNTLIYIIRHDSIEAAAQNWKNFIDDPDWKVVAEETNRNGAILAKAPDSVFMNVTEYSKGYLK